MSPQTLTGFQQFKIKLSIGQALGNQATRKSPAHNDDFRQKASVERLRVCDFLLFPSKVAAVRRETMPQRKQNRIRSQKQQPKLPGYTKRSDGR